MMQYLLSVGVAVFCVFVVHKYFAVRKALRAVQCVFICSVHGAVGVTADNSKSPTSYHPGDRTLLSRQGLGSVLPHIPYISSGANAFLKHERNSATYYGSEILASVRCQVQSMS